MTKVFPIGISFHRFQQRHAWETVHILIAAVQMTTRMTQAPLKLVGSGHPNAQRVAILSEPRHLTLSYAEIPEPGDGEIRVRVKWVGVCGSDVEAFRGTRRPEFVSFPARLGHEVAGVIDKLGPNVEGLRAGDQVTALRWTETAQALLQHQRDGV